MIYTVISTLNENRIESTKRDCRIIRQPLSLLQKEISEYIDCAKNDSVRAERHLAYTTLICSLKAFFDIDNIKLERTADGKPYLSDSNIHISLSHSDGAVAVAISDEGEIGVDIQSQIDAAREGRLKNRFFTDLTVENNDIGVSYYFCEINDFSAELYEASLPYAEDCFTAKWSYAESLMKMSGGGFSDIGEIKRFSEISKCELKELTLSDKYILAVSCRDKE